MPQDWYDILFGDFCDITRGGSPRPIHDYIAPAGIPWVKIADVSRSGTRFINETNEFIRPEGESKSRRVFPGDLILSNSATPGIPMFMGIEACIHDGWMLLRNLRGVDKLFCFYLLQHERANLLQQGNGSVFVNLKTDILKTHRVNIPPHAEQQAIAAVLGALDDKIEQNRLTAQSLERLARAIFRAWFVDFEPVKAKAAGAASFPSMPQPVFDALPTRFVDSTIGPVPEGWEVLRLDDLLTLQRGFDLPKQSRTDGPHPIFAASGLNGWHSEWKVRGPGVTTGRSGVLGQVFFVDRDFWPLNTSLWVKEYKRSNPWHAYSLLQTLDLAQFNAGSAVPTLNRNHVHSLPIVAPSDYLLVAFGQICSSIFSLDQQLTNESDKVAAMRDYLLPQLLSGNVRVKDAERTLETTT